MAMINRLINALFSPRQDLTELKEKMKQKEVPTTPADDEKKVVMFRPQPIAKQSKYQGDIDALEAKFGELTTGVCIETTLQDLLAIVPRNRPRVEAYQGLISELKRMGVELKITSRKSKKGN